MKEFFPEGTQRKKGGYTEAFLREAMQNEEILEGVATLCDEEHNLTVDLGAIKGIILREEGALGIKEGTTRDIALISRVGKSVCFTVSGFKEDEKGETVALLSRRRAQEKYAEYIKENFKTGDIIEAKVTHLDSFGAFCDIGCGIAALLPIDCISVSRIAHPSDRFGVGAIIKTIIKGITDDGKITLSHKELLGTWQENAGLFTVRQTVSGVVRSVEEYGIFVELSPNLAGLAESYEGVKAGDTVGVYIKNIIPEKMKVKLIITHICEEKYIPEVNYFYVGKHIDRFEYSPESSDKKIYTEFAQEIY